MTVVAMVVRVMMVMSFLERELSIQCGKLGECVVMIHIVMKMMNRPYREDISSLTRLTDHLLFSRSSVKERHLEPLTLPSVHQLSPQWPSG